MVKIQLLGLIRGLILVSSKPPLVMDDLDVVCSFHAIQARAQYIHGTSSCISCTCKYFKSPFKSYPLVWKNRNQTTGNGTCKLNTSTINKMRMLPLIFLSRRLINLHRTLNFCKMFKADKYVPISLDQWRSHRCTSKCHRWRFSIAVFTLKEIKWFKKKSEVQPTIILTGTVFGD